MLELIAAASLYFLDLQALAPGHSDQNIRPYPYMAGRSFTSQELCDTEGKAAVKDLTLHTPPDIIKYKGFKWTYTCTFRPIPERTQEQLDHMHNHASH